MENTTPRPKAKKKRSLMASIGLTALWFAGGLAATTLIAKQLPGHPVLVNTNSIDPGIYWTDKQATSFYRGDIATFQFIPRTPEIAALRTVAGHTKFIAGVPGDTIKATEEGQVQVCPLQGGCVEAGTPKTHSMKGDVLTPWIAPGEEIVLKEGEYWMYAPNPNSFDSRYNGPINRDQIRGKSVPWYTWGSYLD